MLQPEIETILKFITEPELHKGADRSGINTIIKTKPSLNPVLKPDSEQASKFALHIAVTRIELVVLTFASSALHLKN